MKAIFPIAKDSPVPEVSVEVDGVPIRMVLDTGAGFTSLVASATRKLVLQPAAMPPGEFAGIGGGTMDVVAKMARQMRMGAITIDHPRFLVVPSTLSASESEGSIGGDILSRYDIELDMSAGRVTFHEGRLCASIPPDWNGHSWMSPFHDAVAGGKQVFVPVSLDGHPIEGVVDTGSTAVIVSRRAALNAGIAQRDIDRGRPIDIVGYGGAAAIGRFVDFKNVVIAGIEIPQLPLLVEDLPPGAGDVIIGTLILRPFRVWISYREHKIWFLERPSSVP